VSEAAAIALPAIASRRRRWLRRYGLAAAGGAISWGGAGAVKTVTFSMQVTPAYAGIL
jgi:hypothetical protein